MIGIKFFFELLVKQEIWRHCQKHSGAIPGRSVHNICCDASVLCIVDACTYVSRIAVVNDQMIFIFNGRLVFSDRSVIDRSDRTSARSVHIIA